MGLAEGVYHMLIACRHGMLKETSHGGVLMQFSGPAEVPFVPVVAQKSTTQHQAY